MKVARQMGLAPNLIHELETREARDLKTESRPTDLLVWITDQNRMHYYDHGVCTRAERVRAEAKRLGAVLLVIPEADDAWDAKQRGAPETEVLELYRQQAISLRRWVPVLYGFIPEVGRLIE